MVAMGLERKVKVAEVVLRCLICGFGALAASLIVTDSQTRTFFSLERKAKFTDMKALVLLVAATGAAAGYSLLQLAARCAAVAMARSGGGALVLSSSRAVAWSVFSCDQAVAYATLAAAAAALQSSVFGKRGQPELQWMGICGLYGAFCRQVGAGIACAVAAVVASALLASVSAFHLFRLYGGGAGGKRSSSAARNGATW